MDRLMLRVQAEDEQPLTGPISVVKDYLPQLLKSFPNLHVNLHVKKKVHLKLHVNLQVIINLKLKLFLRMKVHVKVHMKVHWTRFRMAHSVPMT